MRLEYAEQLFSWIGSPSVKASTVWPPERKKKTLMNKPEGKAAAPMTARRLNLMNHENFRLILSHWLRQFINRAVTI